MGASQVWTEYGRRALEKSFLIFIYHTFRKWTTLYKCPPLSDDSGVLHEPDQPQTRITSAEGEAASRRRLLQFRLWLQVAQWLDFYFLVVQVASSMQKPLDATLLRLANSLGLRYVTKGAGFYLLQSVIYNMTTSKWLSPTDGTGQAGFVPSSLQRGRTVHPSGQRSVGCHITRSATLRGVLT